MKRCIGTHLGVGAVAVGLAWLPAQQQPGAAEEHRSNRVRIGIINTLFRDMPEPVMQVAMRPFKSLLEVQTGMTGELVAGGTVPKLAGLLKEERVHFGVFHGVEFAWARLKDPALKPLVIAVNERHTLRAHLVVGADSKVRTPGGLKGLTAALPSESREHCRLFFERRCVPPGTTPDQFFARVSYPQDTEEALDDVVDGKVDAVVIDGLTLDAYQQLKPGRAAKLKTLLRSEAFPCAVVAYHPGALGDDLITRFRDGLINASSSRRGQRLLEMCRITAFEAIPDNYERMLNDIARAYPPPHDK